MRAKSEKKRKKKGWGKRLLLLLLLLLIAGGVAYRYWGPKAAQAVSYTSYTAAIGSVSNSLSFSGNLQLVDRQTVTAQESVTVREVYAAEGDVVQKGDKLLKLSNGQTVKADFDGTVNQLPVKKDDEAAIGETLVEIADFTHMKVSVRVDEYDIASVRAGSPCRISTTATEHTYSSVIDSINYISSSSGNVAYYTAVCYVEVDPGVYPGMQVTMTVPQEEAENVVVLKEDALSFDSRNQAYVLLKNENGEMEQKYVEVGVTNGNYVEIVSGVSDGDVVYSIAKGENSLSSALGMFSMFGSMGDMGSSGSQRDMNSHGGFSGGGSQGGFSGGGGQGGFSGGTPQKQGN